MDSLSRLDPSSVSTLAIVVVKHVHLLGKTILLRIDIRDGSMVNIDLRNGSMVNIDLRDGSNVDLRDGSMVNIDLRNGNLHIHLIKNM
jgi:hypothetical protein